MSKEAAGEIELNINVTETQFSCYNQQFTGFIKSFNNYNIEICISWKQHLMGETYVEIGFSKDRMFLKCYRYSVKLISINKLKNELF